MSLKAVADHSCDERLSDHDADTGEDQGPDMKQQRLRRLWVVMDDGHRQ